MDPDPDFSGSDPDYRPMAPLGHPMIQRNFLDIQIFSWNQNSIRKYFRLDIRGSDDFGCRKN